MMSLIDKIVKLPTIVKAISLLLLMMAVLIAVDVFVEFESEVKSETAVTEEIVKAEVVEESEPPEMILQYISDCRGRRPELTEFVLSCAKNANPMSDEEGEDLVYACKATAIDLVCTTKVRKIEKISPSECVDEDKQLVSCYNGLHGAVVLND